MNLAFLYMFCLFLLYQSSANAQDVVKKQQQTLSSKTCNVNNYNTFYAGPNKKVESLLVDIMRQLNEIKKELGDSTKKEENATKAYYRNCAALYKAGVRNSGVHTIDPDDSGSFDVFCDQTTDGGGWTVFQKRLDCSVDFYRGWNEYKNGFGDLNGEFWLGLDKINRLTKSRRNKLRVDLEGIEGDAAYAEYDMFAVTSELTKYKMSLGSYSGTAGDSLANHRGALFSTKDRDNDNSGSNCAASYKGAWWYYSSCHNSNLNGFYYHGQHSSRGDGVNWYHWKGYKYSAKRAEMKIRPADF